MGLAISRSIIEDHGGRLWLEPNPEEGVTFRFTLPAAKGNVGPGA
jgi:signal transduction histidine kinase